MVLRPGSSPGAGPASAMPATRHQGTGGRSSPVLQGAWKGCSNHPTCREMHALEKPPQIVRAKVPALRQVTAAQLHARHSGLGMGRNLLQQPLVALTEDTDERSARQQGPLRPHTCVHSGLMVTTVHVEYTTTLCCRDGSGGECRRPAVSLLSRAGCLSGRHSVSILSECRKPALCALPCGRRDLFRSAAAGQAKGAPNAGHTTLISPLKRLAARGETVSCPVQLNDL